MDADQALRELGGEQETAIGNAQAFERATGSTMGNLQKLRYTHKAMIDLIIEHPEFSQNQIAAQFGYTASWLSNIMASDAFQEALAARREEVVDPILRATLQERTKALYLQSLSVLQAKLNSPTVSDKVALAAAELGAKSLGLGGHAIQPPQQPAGQRLAILAENLIFLQGKVKGEVYEGEGTQVQPAA
jgi:hypothetical protein